MSHNHTIVKLPGQQAAKCDDKTYPVNDCTVITNEQICRTFFSKCLAELLNNNSAACQTQSSYHLPSIQQIDDGIVILNDVFPTTVKDEHQISERGTILLMFQGDVTVNKTTYIAHNKNAIINEAPS